MICDCPLIDPKRALPHSEKQLLREIKIRIIKTGLLRVIGAVRPRTKVYRL